ncbi:DNA glycosylase, partial [Blyttiomyces helicus]
MSRKHRLTPGPWSSLATPPAELRLDTTLACGQSFRWKLTGESQWTCALEGRLISLKQTADDVLFRTYAVTEVKAAGAVDDVRSQLRDYFQLDVDLASLYVKWNEDKNFREKSKRFTGIRMLRQDPVENAFSFICTSNNNIARITLMIDKLCERFGQPVGIPPSALTGDYIFYSFPTVTTLARTEVEEELRALGFGYRAKYCAGAARYILKNHSEDWLKSLRELPYEEAKTELLKLDGVGPKVADCILLMSLDKPGAIPVDTHVWQIAKRDYQLQALTSKTLTPKNYEAIGELFRSNFGDYAGWAHSV